MADDIRSAEDLYRLDPGEFVAARDTLAKRLRSDGQRHEAARVAKLRRPPAAAWALNQVARERPDLVATALQAGRALRDATEAALAGDASGLRAATGVERAASDELVAAAAAHLGDAAPATQQRLAGTLRAAVTDEDVADALRRGVLTRDHEAPAFGFAAGLDVVATPPPRAPRTAGRTPRGDRSADAAVQAEQDRVARQAAKQEATEQRRRASERRRELTRLERTAERAEREAAAAEAAAVEARRAADAARQAVDDARRDLDKG